MPGWTAEVYQRKLAHRVLGGTLRTLGPARTGPGEAFPASIKLDGGDQSAQTGQPHRPHAAATRGKQSPAPLCGGSRVGGGEPPGGEGLRGACALTPARAPTMPRAHRPADRAEYPGSMRAARQAPPPRGARAAAAGTSKPRREPAAPGGLPSPRRKRRGEGGESEEGKGRTRGRETAPAWPRTPGSPSPGPAPPSSPRGVGGGAGRDPAAPLPPQPPTARAPAPLTTRSLVCSGSVITAAAPPALPAAAGLAARLPPPGAPSSSGPSSSPLLPPPLLLLQRSGRSRFLPAGPPRLRGPARAVPLPELGSSQAAPFFLGMVAGCGDTGAQCTRAGGGAGEGSAARRGPPHLLLPRPSPRRAPRGDPRRPSPAPSTCEHARKEELSWAPCPAPAAPHSPRLLFFFFY